MGVRFIWGEVKGIDEKSRTATYKPIEDPDEKSIKFDYCVIASGCNFGMFSPVGESLWFPSVWDKVREVSEWKQHDERYLQGRRDHIQQEYEYLPNIGITLSDMMPACLGPLPQKAKDYCQAYP